jgi:hypothetical protein
MDGYRPLSDVLHITTFFFYILFYGTGFMPFYARRIYCVKLSSQLASSNVGSRIYNKFVNGFVVYSVF